MATTESNENSIALALIEQNFSLQNSLVDIIKARDAAEAERQATEQDLKQQKEANLAQESKDLNDYYKSLLPALLPIILPLVQSLINPAPCGEEPEQD